MIPYQIMVACLVTLFIILSKVVKLYHPEVVKSTFFNITQEAAYPVAAFYWIYAIFGVGLWYVYTISGLAAFLAFTYYFFTYVYKSEKEEKEVIANPSLNGKQVAIQQILESNYYLGEVQETKEPIYVTCENSLQVGDICEIVKVGSEIHVEKTIK